MKTLDLNADLGEGFGVYEIGDDDALLKQITSANIACGFHAGDFTVMSSTVRRALACGVRIGAHPGYPDRYGFGRRSIAHSPAEIADLVLYQVGALDALARALGGRVAHIKLHGALYHDVSYSEQNARAVITAIRRFNPTLSFIAPCGSPFVSLAREVSLSVEEEFFADRQYEPDGRLTPRTSANAVLTDHAQIAERVRIAWQEGKVQTRTGSWLPMQVGTVCMHGDHPGAAELAAALRQALEHDAIPVGAPLARCN